MAETGQTNSIILQFVGDISLHGLFCDPQHHRTVADNMSQVAAQLEPCDVRIGNLESPIWGTGGVNTLKNPRLTTTREAAECLLPLQLDVALLATNHVYDCLEEGFENTIGFLGDNGISWLGAGRSRDEAAQPLILIRKGMKIGLLNYCGDETHPSIPQDAGIFVNRLEETRVLDDARILASRVDVVAVFFHWGEVERVRYPSLWQRRLARRLIEAGATLVVGSHVHVLQGDEQWDHGHIFYSVGNFLFCPILASPGRPFQYSMPLVRQVGVASCTVGERRVINRRWQFFSMDQDSLVLRTDDTPGRRLAQDKISWTLACSDKGLSRTTRWENRIVGPAREFLHRSRGLFDMIRKVRLRHLVTLLDSMRRGS